MTEEIIVSGRVNHYIDPHLSVWEWQIPSYLFLGGLAAGIMFFAGLSVIRNMENEYSTAVRRAPVLVPFLLALGLFFLFLDLKHKLFFWRLYTTIRFESPMSWGAWTLLAITPLSIIWAALHIRDFFPKWDWKFDWAKRGEVWFAKNKVGLAWAMVILSLILGIYTGILFSAFNARPLWNTSILGPLFLVSGISTGAAVIVLMSKDKGERNTFAKIDLGLIVIELFLIIHMFMGYIAGSQSKIDAAQMFLGGRFTAPFWVFVVGLGLIIPATLEVMEIRKKRVPYIVAPILVLFGGIILRFIMAHAGQISHWALR